MVSCVLFKCYYIFCMYMYILFFSANYAFINSILALQRLA